MVLLYIGIVVLLVSLLLVLSLYLIKLYNKLIKLEIEVKKEYSNIDVSLKKRSDLIPKIVDTVKGYIKHEQNLLTEITKIRKGENEKELIFLLGFYVFMTYPLPYYILVSGGTIDVSDRVEIVGEYEQEGSFNLAYVNELKGTFPTVMLSYVMPSWTLYEQSDFGFDETEDTEDIDARDYLSLIESQQNSVKVAYEAAGKEFKINE
mgnify:CR=1 FL=1